MNLRGKLFGGWQWTAPVVRRESIEPADGSPNRDYLAVQPVGLDLLDPATWESLLEHASGSATLQTLGPIRIGSGRPDARAA